MKHYLNSRTKTKSKAKTKASLSAAEQRHQEEVESAAYQLDEFLVRAMTHSKRGLDHGGGTHAVIAEINRDGQKSGSQCVHGASHPTPPLP